VAAIARVINDFFMNVSPLGYKLGQSGGKQKLPAALI
jgi:hypothetical protein